MKRILSYGCGVQTVAMGRMILAGDLARPDLVAFADTQGEPAAVYNALEREFRLLREAGIACVIGTAGSLEQHVYHRPRSTHVPLYTINLETGDRGQLLRGCSRDFKVRVVAREARRLFHREPLEMWLGFSTDEIQRMKPNPRPRTTNVFPLIDARVRRSDCEALLRRLGVPVVKSACTFCPYRRDGALRDLTPLERERAIAFDERVRHSRPGFLAFVNDDRVPLRDVFVRLDAQPALLLVDDYVNDACAEGCMT